MWKIIKKYPKETDAVILTLGFVVGIDLFIFLKVSGLDEFGLKMSADRGFHWAIPNFAGLVVGGIFVILEFKVFPKLSRILPKPGLTVLIVRFVTSTLAIVIAVIIVGVVMDMLILGHGFRQAFFDSLYFLKSGVFFSIYIFLMLLSMALNFFRAIGNRFGHGILINYAMGKYREPLEEDRVFMFIDLKNSTAIAEKLGHTKYSRFLNNCFNDLSGLLNKYEADVYQYVGDEVVVTWLVRELKSKSGPSDLFFEFRDTLKNNEVRYQSEFGMAPQFKAAVNAGAVIVTEVGHRRKDLVYHGDVLNTGARVLELCSKLKKELLVTSVVAEWLQTENRFDVRLAQNLALRGKSEVTSVYEIQQNPNLHNILQNPVK